MSFYFFSFRHPGAGRVRQGHGEDRDGRRGQERHRLQQGPGAGGGRPQGTQQEGAYVGHKNETVI